MSSNYVEGREAEDFLARFATAMDDLAERSHAAGLADVALAAGDAGDAVLVLLDVVAKMQRETVPLIEV